MAGNSGDIYLITNIGETESGTHGKFGQIKDRRCLMNGMLPILFTLALLLPAMTYAASFGDAPL